MKFLRVYKEVSNDLLPTDQCCTITVNVNTDLFYLYFLSVQLSLKYYDMFGRENKLPFAQIFEKKKCNKLELYMKHQILTLKCLHSFIIHERTITATRASIIIKQKSYFLFKHVRTSPFIYY